MKKYFFTGLAVTLPILLTLLILQLLLKLLTAPFVGVIEVIFNALIHAEWLPKALNSPDLVRVISQISLLFLLFLFTVFIGFLGRLFLVNALFQLGDRLIHSEPFANKIYKAVQDVIKNLMNQETPSFSQVVQVPFPHERALVLGFITKEEEKVIEEHRTHSHISVYVPGTPNPMMGFVLLVPAAKVQRLDLTVEQAVKFIVSCGVISPTGPGTGAPNALSAHKAP
jgi:uncharacterized membrane protein